MFYSVGQPAAQSKPTPPPATSGGNSLDDMLEQLWATPKKRKVLGGVGIALFLFIVFSVLVNENQNRNGVKPGSAAFNDTPTAKAPAPPPPPRTDLNAQVRFTGTQFIITNKESVDRTNVKMEINGGIFSGGYQLLHDRMKANETYTVGALQFADSDGKRFNPFQMKPQKFTISADSSIGHLFYVGGWN